LWEVVASAGAIRLGATGSAQDARMMAPLRAAKRRTSFLLSIGRSAAEGIVFRTAL
jgi:hypothetical protein